VEIQDWLLYPPLHSTEPIPTARIVISLLKPPLSLSAIQPTNLIRCLKTITTLLLRLIPTILNLPSFRECQLILKAQLSLRPRLSGRMKFLLERLKPTRLIGFIHNPLINNSQCIIINNRLELEAIQLRPQSSTST